MSTLFRRIAYWWRRNQHDAELAEEIEAHRLMAQERLERMGAAARDAADASRRTLGNVALAREDARSVWLSPQLESVVQDVRYALRGLRRNLGFSAAVILVTALGIGATTSVFGLIDGLILKPLPVREPKRLVYFQSPSFSYPQFTEVRNRTESILSGLFAWNLDSVNVDWDGDVRKSEVLFATGTFYETLGITPAIGRLFTKDDDRVGGGTGGLVAVLSYDAWQRRFNRDPSVIGRIVRIERQPFAIIGVAPPGFFGVAPGLAPEITVPLTTIQDERTLTSGSSAWLHFMGRLRDGVAREQANAALQGIWTAALEATTATDMPAARRAKFLGRRTALEPAVSGFSRVTRQFSEPLRLLFALVGLLFAVACASVANLLLSRGIARQREMAVRLAIGAGRGRLVRQLFTESLVSAAAGCAIGVVLASWTASTLVAMMASREEPIVLDVSPSWRATLFALGLMAVTVVVCSIVPALRTTRFAPGSTLKETGHGHSGGTLGRWSLGKWLVVSQVTVTMVLLVGAALFVRSLSTVLAQDAGFDRDRVVVVAADAEFGGYQDARLQTYFARLRESLANVPGVESASLSVMPPISNEDGNWTQSIAIDDEPTQEEPSRHVYFNAVSPGYFNTLGMRLLRGRDFTPDDVPSSRGTVIVNEALARRFFPDANPLGHRISVGLAERRRNLEIVGVVQDSKYQTLQEPNRRIAYLPLFQQGVTQNVYAEVRSAGQLSAIFDRVRAEARRLDATVPVRIETIGDRIRDSLVTERAMAVLASALSVTALGLACAGLYGLLAYAVSRQSKDIGLRLALGAERRTVLWMVLRDSILLTVVGIAFGIGTALALGRYARNLLYQVTTTDPASIAAAAVVLVSVAFCAGLIPARRAARVDPVVSLRYE